MSHKIPVNIILVAFVFIPAVLAVPFGIAASRHNAPRDYSTYMGQSTDFPSPKVGSIVSLPTADAFGRRLPKGGKIFMVVAGDCYVCSSSRWSAKRIVSTAHTAVLIVYWLRKEELPSEITALRSKAFVICDPKQLALPTTFAYAAPTAYVVDGQSGKLLNSEREDETIESFAERL